MKTALKQLPKKPIVYDTVYDKLEGNHALNCQFVAAIGPWTVNSVNDVRFEITYSESWGVTVRNREDNKTCGIPWAAVLWFEPRST